MKSVIYITFLIFFLNNLALAQRNQTHHTVFVKIIDEVSNKFIPGLQVNLLEEGRGLNSCITDDSQGIAKCEIPIDTERIKIEVDSKDIIIRNPNKHAPKDNNTLIVVFAKISPKRLLELEINKLYREIDSINLHYKDSLSIKTDKIKKLSYDIDSLNNKIREIKINKKNKYKKYILKISKNYYKGLQNMCVTLKKIKTVFINEYELRNLNTKIKSLNKARDELHENHEYNILIVNEYWNSKTSEKVKELYSISLDSIYEKLIIPSDKLFIIASFFMLIGIVYLFFSFPIKTNIYYYFRNSVIVYSAFSFFVGSAEKAAEAIKNNNVKNKFIFFIIKKF